MKHFSLKLVKGLSYTTLAIACLCVFAFTVRHVVKGGERLGVFTETFNSFIEFPLLVKQVLEDFSKPAPYLVKVEGQLDEINRLDKDLFALKSYFEEDGFLFELVNLRTDSILHTWTFPTEQHKGSYQMFIAALPLNPILLDDGSIIGVLNGTENLFRLDKASNVIWHNSSKFFHHSLNLSHDNFLWSCSWGTVYTRNAYNNTTTEYMDDFITKVDIETGAIVYEKSISEILISNGYISLVHGYGNEENSIGTDLFHLNDIQPILLDGQFWKKGDLLLSLRNRSMILLYRPETNKILRLISGPFLLQHDVDVISADEISIFNNNRTHTLPPISDRPNKKPSNLVLKSSNIVVYNFSDSSFTYPYRDLIEQEEIFTYKQGAHTFLRNGALFMESTESCTIYLFRDSTILLKKYANQVKADNNTKYPNWMRIYEEINFK